MEGIEQQVLIDIGDLIAVGVGRRMFRDGIRTRLDREAERTVSRGGGRKVDRFAQCIFSSRLAVVQVDVNHWKGSREKYSLSWAVLCVGSEAFCANSWIILHVFVLHEIMFLDYGLYKRLILAQSFVLWATIKEYFSH